MHDKKIIEAINTTLKSLDLTARDKQALGATCSVLMLLPTLIHLAQQEAIIRYGTAQGQETQSMRGVIARAETLKIEFLGCFKQVGMLGWLFGASPGSKTETIGFEDFQGERIPYCTEAPNRARRQTAQKAWNVLNTLAYITTVPLDGRAMFQALRDAK